MNSRELLSLLTARVQRFHLAPGGVPNLTAEDVAHALGMLRQEQVRLYARIKYSGQIEYADKLAGMIRVHVMTKKLKAGWRIPRPDFLLDVGYLMIVESVDPNLCPTCDGRAEVHPEVGPVIMCEKCAGTGKRAWQDADRAAAVRLAKSSWSETWSDRYKEAKEETVDKWEAICGPALHKRLSEPTSSLSEL